MMNKQEEICWYHGKLSRSEAEAKLKEDDLGDGSFLVRESNSSTGDYVLSVLNNNQVIHYQIRRHTEDFFSIEENIKIHGLDSLIEHYQSGEAKLDGLILTVPCKGEAPPPDSRRHGRTNLLHRATREGNYKVVSEMLKTGYRHELKNQDGQTAVHLASMKGFNDILRKLIEYGANVNSRDTAGYTPLHYACQNNFPTTVRLLVQIGKANIQARNTLNEWVPLHEAAFRGFKEVVQELLSLNAPANPRTKDNYVPAQLARSKGFLECAEILENYKCPIPKTHRSQWYHGTLDRKEAEKIIRNYCTQNGTFLVRYSDRNNGSTVLTLLNEGMFFNYIIRSSDNFLFIDDGPYLDSLEHIIEYYSFIPDGLPTILQTPVPPTPKPPVPEFSTIPRQKKKTSLPTIPSQDTGFKNIQTSNSASTLSLFHNIKFTSNHLLTSVPNNINNNYVVDNLTDSNNLKGFIPPDRLTLGAIIGSGEFGSVHKGVYKNEKGEEIKVAIKTLLDEHVDSNRGAFLNEADLMMKLNHHCIVKLIGVSLGPPLLMVQELIALGSLLSYVILNRSKINANYEFKIWSAQIACGMKYLEEQRFIHRDLAARNILLASQHQAKISDFGLSKALGADHEYYRAMHGGKWPLKWYAPESYNFGTFSHKSDVWSFGVTIWEMYSFGEQPYGELKGSEAIRLIESGERLQKPLDCPDHIYNVMLQCWEYEADKRPTFTQLLNILSSDTDYMNIRELVAESNLS